MIASDSFNRPNAGTLGSNWQDPNSAWSIDSDQALSTDAGVAIYNTPHLVPDESMIVLLVTTDEIAGDKYRVLVNVLDEDNYHFAEFERQGTNTSVLTLGKCSGGVETTLASDTIQGLTGTSRTLAAKIADNEFCSTVSNAALSLVKTESAIISHGYYSGMESLAAGMRVDDFVFEEHFQTNPSCGLCLCNCEDNYIPPLLNAHLSGTGRMTGLNCDIELAWDRVNSYWTGSLTCCNQPWQLIFNCPETPGDGDSAKLVVQLGCNNSDGYHTTARLPSSSECNPLSITFGPYTVGSSDLVCQCGAPLSGAGTYTIVVTE